MLASLATALAEPGWRIQLEQKAGSSRAKLPTHPRALQHAEQGPEPGAWADEEVEQGAAAAAVTRSRGIGQGRAVKL